MAGRPFDGPYRTILIQGNNNIVFDGTNASSMFVIRRKLRLIIQNATFKNGFLKRAIIQNRSNFRVGGGAVEIVSGAFLRVYGCTFRDNAVDEWNDTPGGGYDGVGENQNGAAIRLNTGTTGEVFKSVFKNNKAVTGGAIGATFINKLTIMGSRFEGNISTSYNTKNSTNRRIPEGAGAIRVDRTALPFEIYRTHFSENAANIKVSVIEVFMRPIQNSGAYPNPDGDAFIIDDCVFKDNKYYNFKGAVDPERGDFFAGCILFHGGPINNSFRGAKMKITNTKFIGNEVSETHIRAFLEYEVANSIFADTKFIRLKDKNGNFRTGKGALMLRTQPKAIVINNCTFYNNEPNPDDRINATASDIFFWGNPGNFSLNNSIFYRKNSNPRFKQVSKPIRGSGNNQFIPGANMSLFAEVSTTTSAKSNPNIVPNKIVDMCLGSNALPANIGGLSDCSGTPPPSPPQPPITGVAIPGTIQTEKFVTKSGSVKAENTPGGGQNLGFIKNGDFTEYDITVSKAGTYKLDAYVSSRGAGGNIVVSVGGTNLGSLRVPVNNAWHFYIAVSTDINLAAGVQKIRFTYTAGSSRFLFNFERAEIAESTAVKLVRETKPLNVTVYKNPKNDNILQLAGDTQNVFYALYNISGRIIEKERLTNSSISIEAMADGIYLLELTKDRERVVVKIVK